MNTTPLQQADSHILQHLRAIPQTNTLVAKFSNTLTGNGGQLGEVWLVPEHETSVTSRFLESAAFNTVEELLHYYRLYTTKTLALAEKLLRHFFSESRLPITEAMWHFEVLSTPAGPVISVVFGRSVAMEKMYAAGLRQKPEPLSKSP